MNAATITEKKVIAAAKDQKVVAAEIQATSTGQETPVVPENTLKLAIEKLDVEMKDKLTGVIEALVPGNPASFNTGVMKEIAKIENRKNRIIAGRLEMLLRKGNPEAKEIVDRLLAIAV